jgi:tetratricopeptide (TPR) repeat protein
MSHPSVVLGLVAVLSVGRALAQGPARQPSIPELERAARTDSLDGDVLYRLALAYDLAKQYDNAERVARQAVAVDPREAQAWLLLAYLPFDRRPKLWKEVRKDRVPSDWRAAVDEATRFEHRAFLIDPLVDFRVQGAPQPPEDMVTIPEYGQETTDYLLLLGLGAFGWRYVLSYSALDLYAQRQYKDKPVDSIPSGLFWWRGLAAAHLGAFGKAIPDIRVLLDRSLKQEANDSLIQIDLGTNDYRYLLAVFLDRAGRSADAKAMYQEALANDLGLYMAHVRLARLYARFKLWDDAIEEARRSITANPDDPTGLVELGEIERDAGRLAEAETTLQQAAASSPRNPRIPYELGMVQQQLGHLADAKATLTRFLAIAPSRLGGEIADAKQRLTSLPRTREP